MANITAIYNINVKQGATYDKVLTWKNANGNPIDLTGATALMKVKTSKCDNTCSGLIIELSTTNGRIILGGVLGTIQLLISAADNISILTTCGQFYYDLSITIGSAIYYPVEGTFTVESSISK